MTIMLKNSFYNSLCLITEPKNLPLFSCISSYWLEEGRRHKMRCLPPMAHPSLLPPGAWAVSGMAFWLQWLCLCHVPVPWAPWEHQHTRVPPQAECEHLAWHPKTCPEPGPTAHQADLGLTLAFWINLGKGGDFLFSS